MRLGDNKVPPYHREQRSRMEQQVARIGTERIKRRAIKDLPATRSRGVGFDARRTADFTYLISKNRHPATLAMMQ